MQFYSHTIASTKKSGFTLVEIIVSLGIFSVVAVVALGSLVRIVSANKKAQTLHSAITNLNFALESMSRELRVGSTYYCKAGNFTINKNTLNTPNTCNETNNNGVTLAFKSTKRESSYPDCPLIIAYRIVSGGPPYKLQKGIQTDCNDPINNSATEYSDIVSPEVTITGYYFKVTTDQTDSNYKYPIAFIGLSGYAGVREAEKTYFNVQTAISARLP